MEPCQSRNINAQEFEYFRKCRKHKLECHSCEGTLSNPQLITSCQHIFCKKCIEPWLMQKSCPSCKSYFESKNVIYAEDAFKKMCKLWEKAVLKYPHALGSNYNTPPYVSKYDNLKSLLPISSNSKVEDRWATLNQLIQLGVSFTITNRKNEQTGTTTLGLAAADGQAAIVKKLIQDGVDLNDQNKDGITALMFAVYHRRNDAVKVLLDSRAEVDIADIDGNTALLHACNQRYPDTVEMLLKHGASVDLKNQKTNVSPLALAIVKGETAIVGLLLAYDAKKDEQVEQLLATNSDLPEPIVRLLNGLIV